MSIDKKQLGNSIRGYYGSDKIDADEYLRRFIDIEYTLPEPNVEDFCKYLYIYFRFDEFFGDNERIRQRAFENDKDMFLKLSIQLSSENHLSLRQIEKLFSYTRLALKSFNSRIFVYPDLLFLMIYLKYYESNLYDIIRNHKINIQDLVNNIGEVFANNLKRENEERYSTTVTGSIAKLIKFYDNYNNYKKHTTNKPLIETTTNNEEKEKLSFLTKNINEEKLFQLLKHYRNSFEGFDMDLDFFTDKIDLLEPLQQIE